MIGALVYLRVASLGNWVARRLKRLRQPKYLIGTVVGGAYLWFFLIRPTRMPSGAATASFQYLPLVTTLGILCLVTLIRILLAWLSPDKPGIGFTEAEIAVLFPAPLTRKALVHYKLLSSQALILVSATIVTLAAGRWNTLGGNHITHGVGWWLLTSVLSLHNMGAALTVGRMTERGVSPLKRQVVVSTVIVAYIGAFLYALWQGGVGTARSPADFLVTPRPGLMGWLLLPFRVVLAPFFAPTWADFGRAIGPGLAVLAAHYLWVYRSEASFEEASIAQAERRAKRVAQVQAGRFPRSRLNDTARGAPFRLNPAGGRPEVAFLWINSLSTRSFFSLRTLAIAAAVIVVGCVVLGTGNTASRSALRTAGAIAAVFAGYVLVVGPQFARQDLRSDLGNADLLKTYPLRGWRIVLGQLLTPTAILTGLVWLAILTETLALALTRRPAIDWGFLAAGALAAGALTPLIALLHLMIPNAGVLLFPSWASATRVRDRGIDVMGQRLLFVFGQFLVVALALLPAVACGVLVGFAAFWIFPAALSVVVGALTGLAILGVEIGAGVAWLGSRFERYDVSAEPAP